MLRIAICDDEQEAVESHKKAVEAALGLCRAVGEIITYTRSDNLFCDIVEDGFHFDLILLDIEMPGMDGMELARLLRGKGDRTEIIFVTGIPDYAPEGYDLEAVSYLVKPVKRERLCTALDRAREKAGRRNAILAPVCAGELERIYVSDISFLEGAGHETILRKRD